MLNLLVTPFFPTGNLVELILPLPSFPTGNLVELMLPIPSFPAVNFDLKSSLLLWLVYVLMGLSFVYNRHTYLKQRIFIFAWLSILRGLVTLGVQPTLFIMGLAQVGVVLGVANIETTLLIMGLDHM